MPPYKTTTTPKRAAYTHQFVEHLPDKLEEGVLYVSVRYATSAHRCFCGCGREVVTPLHPTKWRLTFDGAAVSLHPSVGSWALPCKSHYWLQNGGIDWAEALTDREIRAVQGRDLRDQARYYAPPPTAAPPTTAAPPSGQTATADAPKPRSLLSKIFGRQERKWRR